jgi:lipopolysaccharide/colanic/teichoic acid biosynthesis glycosyltransferase
MVDKTFEPYPEHVKAKINNVRPGLTGVGSIVFRDEEKLLSETKLDSKDYYAAYIAPYKGELELWYQEHLTFYTDFIIVFMTAWAIVFPQSDLVFKMFRDLPEKPEYLR